MRWVSLLLLSLAGVQGEPARYELRGRLVPATRASVSEISVSMNAMPMAPAPMTR